MKDRAIHLVGKDKDGRNVYAANKARPWTDYVRVGERNFQGTWHPGMGQSWREFKSELGIVINK